MFVYQAEDIEDVVEGIVTNQGSEQIVEIGGMFLLG